MTTNASTEAGRKHPLAECEICPLRDYGTFVPSAGPESAKIAFVGEAPAAQDARNGIIFSGPSGKLLDKVMEYHGIIRETVFFSNATLCRPPDNSAPPKSAILACRVRLHNELIQHDVDTVVALGNSAAESLLGRGGVTTLRQGRGKSSPFKSLENMDIYPTVNPAACLRQGDMFPNLVQDIGKVVTHVQPWNEPAYVVAYDENTALEFIRGVDYRIGSGSCAENPERVLVVDIEVDIEKDAAFDHPNQYGMLCVGIGYDRDKVLVLSDSAMESGQVRNELGALLRKYRIVAQNGKFDLAGLYPHLGALSLYFDTMLASYTFDERPGVHGLKYMAQEFLGAPDYEADIEIYNPKKLGYGVIPRELLYKYNAYDVACTYALYLMWLERFKTSPDGEDLRRVHDHLVRAGNELMYVELNGIAVDREYLRSLDRDMREDLIKLEHDIDDAIAPLGISYDKKYNGINPRSPVQVKQFLTDNNIRVDSTNEDTITTIMERKSLPKNEDTVREFCRLLLLHRRQSKLHGTYVKGIANRLYRGRVYPTFLLHGTVTGRLSCRNPNLQNIPRDSKIRNMFVPSKPTNLFVQVDYAQAELRVLSFLASDNYFRTIFNEGERDLFDDLTPILYPHADKKRMSSSQWKELRIRVKAYVYGVSYGRSEFSIASEFGISVQEARAGMQRFFEVIPEIVTFREQTRQHVLDGDDLVTPWGRHRRYSLITPENQKDIMNEALAFLPQSTSSDMCLQALAWTRQDLRGKAWIRNIVHDSLLLECAAEDVEEVKFVTERNMIESAQSIVGDYVQFAVDSKIGKSWGEV